MLFINSIKQQKFYWGKVSNMKILLVGNYCGWMKLHLEHITASFQKAGCEVIAADYHKMERWCGLKLGKWEDEYRQRELEKLVKKVRPDICFFAGSCKFDFARLKSYWNGVPVFHDYDGPRRNKPDDYYQYGRNGIYLTVSRYIERELKKAGENVFYVPHGVDTDYYSPENSGSKPYNAECSYIGRATPRRVEFCSVLNCDLALYGERWKKTDLAPLCREKKDIQGMELVGVYKDSQMMINILQEPLDKLKTILSLQCFAIPSTQGCLCAEWVEEFPEAFEEGKEIFTFKTKEELSELAPRILKDKEICRKVGEAGRKRCLAEHTHFHRAQQILKILN
jgi:glycosyltransferase involved in cell wall biosynthesis